MPGFLGGSTSGSGTGGEISFPKEFIDPVTKLRISQPENLIDTDFEYGLQPTKWETVELINNTPSFFSKSGDTTIPNIVSITTNAGTREITVKTGLDHGLAVGIPISVTGTKSITADGSYIINSIPNTTTFTYLCKDNQPTTASIEDLYSSIITGEFFQGSQLRISDSEGITTDGESLSTLTVTTPSTHGFGTNTPFYFLNLNSTISQEFQAANTAAKSFDSSNSATAQTFDGSNTLSSINIDWSNSATVGGVTSTISGVNTTSDTITVSHGTENFNGRPLGTPLYYSVTAGAGYFFTNPRGVVFLKTTDALGTSSSTFQVSEVPDGPAIDIEVSMSGTFQLANQARVFAGNNVNPLTETTITIIDDAPIQFDGANEGIGGTNGICTVANYSGSLVNVTVGTGLGLDYYTGAMVRYTTDGAAATGLTNNTTYFIDTFLSGGSPGTFAFTLKPLPTGSTITSISGGTGVQRFTKIGVSVDKDIVHVKNAGFTVGDLVEYKYPVGGSFSSSSAKNYYFIDTAYDTHNFKLSDSISLSATGGQLTQDVGGYRIHRFTTVGTHTLTVTGTGNLEYMVIGGGGGGGTDMGGGGGAGGYLAGTIAITTPGAYTVTVGAGGRGSRGLYGASEATLDYDNGGNSSLVGPGGSGVNIVAIGGGKGGSNHRWDNLPTVPARTGGSGGGMAGNTNASGAGRIAGTSGQGFAGGVSAGTGYSGSQWYSGGGGGAGGQGLDGNLNGNTRPSGGPGVQNAILGTNYFWAGGGGGGIWSGTDNGVGRAGNGGSGGGGGGAGGVEHGAGGTGGLNNGQAGYGPNGQSGQNNNANGGSAGANTGSGGGGNSHNTTNDIRAGAGGSGIVVVRYQI